MHFVPILDDALDASVSSLMLLKIDLGNKKDEKLGDETSDNQDQFDEAKRTKTKFVGFLTNINSSQKLNYPSANSNSILHTKLKPVIEDFKQTTDYYNEAEKETNRIKCLGNGRNDEKILFSVIAGKLPVTKWPTGKTKSLNYYLIKLINLNNYITFRIY